MTTQKVSTKHGTEAARRQSKDNGALKKKHTKPLNGIAKRRLEKLEQVIENSQVAFVASGTALKEIRDAGLYKETHGSFEKYCADRWRISRSQAYRLIDGAAVAMNLTKKCKGMPMPMMEAQVRPLLILPPARARKVWCRAVKIADGQAPTPAQVREAAEGCAPAQKGKVKTVAKNDIKSPLGKALSLAEKARDKAASGDDSNLTALLDKLVLLLKKQV